MRAALPSPAIAAALLALGLVACTPKMATVTCPPLKPYPAEFQRQAAAELKQIADRAPAVATMINDYGATRNAIRACIAKRDAR